MAWFVHYWNEIDNRNVCSSEISAREDAMRKACSLMREKQSPLRTKRRDAWRQRPNCRW